MFRFILNLQQLTLFGMNIAHNTNGRVCKNHHEPESSLIKGRKAVDLISQRWPSCRRVNRRLLWL